MGEHQNIFPEVLENTSVLLPQVNDQTLIKKRFRFRRGKRHDSNFGLSIDLLIDILSSLLPGESVKRNSQKLKKIPSNTYNNYN